MNPIPCRRSNRPVSAGSALRFAAILLAALAIAGPPPAAANGDGQAVEFVGPDGFLLHASYWSADGTAPGVLLLHQCNRDRHSWNPAAAALADAGFHVLALDFRGFGESVGDGVTSFREQGNDLWPLWVGDVNRAVEFLESVPGVDAERIGVMGASCGGTQALMLASRNPAVRAIAFLSSSLPWLDEVDLATFRENRSLPLLAIAAEDDGATAERTREEFERSAHPASRLVLYKGDAHGVPLFELDPSLPATIARFFADNL